MKNPRKLSISGPPGCGSSTLVREWAKKYESATTSAGDEVRAMILAESGGELTEEYEERAKSDPNIDKKLDGRMQIFMNTHEKCVLDWRLCFLFDQEAVSILMLRDEAERMWLIQQFRKDGQGKSIEWLTEFNRNREENFAARFREIYGVEDFRAREHYDIVIDVTGMSVEDELALVENSLEKFVSQSIH